LVLSSEHPGEQLAYVLFWGGSSALCLASIYHFGIEFVDRPKLVATKTKTE